MISDTDRRAVARRLRGIKDTREGCGHDMCCDLWSAIFDSDYRCTGLCDECEVAVLDSLADLIEPEPERTCRVESSHEEEGDGCYSYFEYELTCGHEMAWEDQLPPSYCPECGRRVLYDSNDYI